MRAHVRRDEGQTTQAGVHVLAARAIYAALYAECETDFGAFLDEVCDERGRKRHPALETLGRADGQLRLRFVISAATLHPFAPPSPPPPNPRFIFICLRPRFLTASVSRYDVTRRSSSRDSRR